MRKGPAAERHALRWRFEKDGEQFQVEVKGPVTLDEASLSRSIVLAGVGLGYFIEADVRDDIGAGSLVAVLGAWMPRADELCIYYPGRRNPSAAHRAFVDLAREFASKARNTGV